MSYQQAFKDLAKNFSTREAKHTVSPRGHDNNEKASLSQPETARETFKAQSNQTLSLSEKLQVDTVSTQCPEHPEEELQFYCYNNNTIVCAECIVKGGYTGLEIANTKRAAEKIRGKLENLAQEADMKQEECDGLNKELQDQEEKIEEVFAGYEEEIKKEMENLRQAVNKKEQEMLEKVNAVKEEKLKGLRSSTGSFKEFQEDIHKIKTAIKSHVNELNDVNICNYYSRTGGVIMEHLNGKFNEGIEKTKKTVKFLSMQNHIFFTQFHEDCQKINEQIDHVSAQVNKTKHYTLDNTDISARNSIPPSKPPTPNQKDIKQGDDVTDRKKSARDALISECLNQLDSTPTPQAGGNVMPKTLQLDQLSPKDTPRQGSARSPLLIDMGKYDLDRNSYMKNFSQKYGSSSTNIRSQATLTKLDLREFTKPVKTTTLRENPATLLLTESSAVSARLTPRQESTSLLKSPKVMSSRKWPAEVNSEQFGVLKNVGDKAKPVRRERNYSFLTPSTVNKDKDDKALDLKRIGSSTARTEKSIVEKCVMRESKLKEKLEELSSKFFN